MATTNQSYAYCTEPECGRYHLRKNEYIFEDCIETYTCYICEKIEFKNLEEIQEHIVLYHDFLIPTQEQQLEQVDLNYIELAPASLANIFNTLLQEIIEQKADMIEQKLLTLTQQEEYKKTLDKTHIFDGYDVLLKENKIKIIKHKDEMSCNICDEKNDEYIVCSRCLPIDEKDYSFLCKKCFEKSYTTSCSEIPKCIYCRKDY